ncbi:Uncharacterised protein [Streptococcus pneumoniae]|nr:Uncharacterised protein [Streptococcus pneumoniae]
MNELDISNTQAAVLILVLIGILLYLNHLLQPFTLSIYSWRGIF